MNPNQMVDSERIRANLILGSLYLSAYEIMKATIIDTVAMIFVFAQPPEVEVPSEYKKFLGKELFEAERRKAEQRYQSQIDEYQKELKISYKNRINQGLIPSSKWWVSQGVLDQEDINSIKRIRGHRNEVAHELPSLLLSREVLLNWECLDLLVKINRKVATYWARMDADIPDDVKDEEIKSGMEMVLILIWEAALDFFREIMDETPDGDLS